MTPERWAHIKRILHEVLELPEDEREGYPQRVCGKDLALRQEVDSLVAASEQAASFLDTPAGLPETPAGLPEMPRKDQLQPGQRVGQ